MGSRCRRPPLSSRSSSATVACRRRLSCAPSRSPSEKCCAAIEATRLREQSDANFFQALQSHEKKGSVGAKLDELKAMLPTGVDASQAAALISSLKAELARE